jgi:polysaccharide export outer membrane protein
MLFKSIANLTMSGADGAVPGFPAPGKLSHVIKRLFRALGPKSWVGLAVLLCLRVPFAFGQDYVVGESDVLAVTVYDNDDLNTVARVNSEGAVIMPLIGSVKVDGLKVTEVVNRITDMYADGYLVNPQVTVFVQEYRSSKATVLGEVNHPGLHELQGHISFLEVVSKAGGFTDHAGNVATVKRQKNGQDEDPAVITIDLKKLVEQGDLSLDIPIQNGDRIYVRKAPVFYISGQVRSPNAYKLEQGTTIIKAITIAGGFTDKAAPTKVKIVRKVNNREEISKRVKMDVLVKPDDVIVVPESFF